MKRAVVFVKEKIQKRRILGVASNDLDAIVKVIYYIPTKEKH